MYIVNTALLSAVPEFPVIIDGNSQLLLFTVAYFGPLLRSTSSQNSIDQRNDNELKLLTRGSWALTVT